MSNDPSDNPADDGGLDLSSLNFGPAWARDDKESKSLKKFKDRGDRDDSRKGDRRGGRGGGPRQGGGGNRGGGDRKFQGGRGGGKGRGRFDDRRPQRTEVEPPAGFTAKLMPLEESLDVLAKEIMQTGRTYSVFDLAKVCLQGRDRFRATFENKDQKFFRCREDNSVWLTKEEAIRQLWRGDWLKKFYTAVQTEGEAPSGSFQAVAKCGISGELLGPPNYHGYQQNIATLHRERFGHMSLDAYKSKVRMEHGEEAVEAWLESMKTVTKWKESTGEEVSPEESPEVTAEKEAPEAEEKPAEDPVVEQAAEETASETPSGDEAAEKEEAPVVDGETSDAEEEAPAAEEVTSESDESAETSAEEVASEDVELFETSRDVERHFLTNHFETVFEETSRAWVLGDIKASMLSPGLLTLLKRTVQEEKRYPANLMPIVCRQLSGRHVAVFKWDKKLKVGPSRPHAVSASLSLAERPQSILDHLAKNDGCKLSDLWAALLPENATDEQKHEWYHDLHWILNQGHAILLNDTTLHLAKQSVSEQPKKKAAKKKTAAKVEEKAKEEKKEDPSTKEKAPEEEKAPADEKKAPEEEEPSAKEEKSEPSSPTEESQPSPPVEEPPSAT